MPTVSIVMPVFNGERFLRQSIQSVLNQTLTDWELILINDCSTDKSLDIMLEYAKNDKRIHVYSNEYNSKIPTSLNNGFERAIGEYYTWTSDDNIYEKDAIEKMAEYLNKNSEVGLVYADMKYIDADGVITGQQYSLPKDIVSYNCIGACFMYRASIAKKIGGYNKDWFLVEDYEYWLRIMHCSQIGHIPEELYQYRRHASSLTETKMLQVRNKLYDLRMMVLPWLKKYMSLEDKRDMFKEMWIQNIQGREGLIEAFWDEGKIPSDLEWLQKGGCMDLNRKVVLFGAGAFGKKALDYLGEDKVYCYVDNNATLVGTKINDKPVKAFGSIIDLSKEYQIVISVDARKASVLAEQLENAGVKNYITYLELVNNFKKPDMAEQVEWIEVTNKAAKWVINNSNPGEGIINNSQNSKSYPEVTGYYIPTLLRWGFRDLAIGYAKWLCSIQHAEGAWYDTHDKNPYVFDTAQILKGLVSIYDICPEVEKNIINGCEWLINQINTDGRLVTPDKGEWGADGICSELIHLYCLSPLIDAARLLNKPNYEVAARRVINFYISNYKDKILEFGFLSHFYAYVMEALCDIGELSLAREAMHKISEILDDKGYVPAYKNVNWVCSTGMFQLAIVWYKLGDLERGNKALAYAARLQNKSGGWFGSYSVIDNPSPTDSREYPDYLPMGEISWAVKYYLDAIYYKNCLEFDAQASDFSSHISKDDGRYKIILSEIKERLYRDMKILDVGCGKGRYLKNLISDIDLVELYAVDISDKVMNELDNSINKKNGLLTCIPYENNTFDVVYAVESLEHAIFPENAIKEMLRVTKPGGKIIIIDKNKKAAGMLEIDAWEQWFDDDLFVSLAAHNKCSLRIIDDISYDSYESDGLFRAWVLPKGE